MSIIPDEPAHQGKEKLSEGGVDIEEVGSLEIVGSKLKSLSVLNAQERRASDLAEMDLIKNDLVGMTDPPEPGNE
jgi:hypothetical protein